MPARRHPVQKFSGAFRQLVRMQAACLMASASCFLFPESAAAQDAAPTGDSSSQQAGGNVEAPSFRDTPGGALLPTVFRTSGASLPSVHSPGDYGEQTKIGEAEGSASLTLPHFDLNAPFLVHRGFEPQDADLKVGPLFFRLTSMSVSALGSDNVNLSENHREAGVIAISRLDGAVIAQLSEGLQFAAAGSLVYFPLESKGGIVGWGTGPFTLGLAAGLAPAAKTQLSYLTTVAGWQIIFSDDFHMGQGSYSDSTRDDTGLFEGFGFEGSSRAGRYAYVERPVSQRGSVQSSGMNNNSDFVYFSNAVSAATTHMLPHDVRMDARVLHEDVWYNIGSRGLPSLRDEAGVQLTSVRENLRFKPFLRYDVQRTNFISGVNQQVEAGVTGPITSQLDFTGSVGVLIPTGGRSDSMLWTLALQHTAGPYTTEYLTYRRSLTEFDEEIAQSVIYNVRQVLGPDLYADAYAEYGKFENLLTKFGSNHDDFRTGVSLTYAISPRTQFRALATYARVTENGETGTTWTGRAEVSRYITDSINLKLLYQYQQLQQLSAEENYYENLLMMTLTKTFH